MLEENCKQCGKIPVLCICKDVKPAKIGMHILILRHPQEQDKDLGTAPILSLSLKDKCTLRTGLSWPNLKAALQGSKAPLQDSSRHWAVLYLGTSEKFDFLKKKAKDQEVLFLDKKGMPERDQESIKENICGLVVLDGNWSQSKALWWRNPWLLKLHRAICLPQTESLYGPLRKEPRKECLSTLESVISFLHYYDEPDAELKKMTNCFERMLSRYEMQK